MTKSRLHVVAAVLQDAERYFVQQRQPGKHMAGHWEFPGGKIETGETAWTALVRELHEELSIKATSGAPFVTLSHSYPDRDILLDVWRVTKWRGDLYAQEQQVTSWHSLAELAQIPMLPSDIPVLEALANFQQ